MSDKTVFGEAITQGYTFKGESLVLGTAIFQAEPLPNHWIKVPLKTINRHGLIAGATGSGKTKTLQIIAEQLSRQGVPSLLMDIKGDLSGIAMPGASNPKIEDRHQKIGIPYSPGGSPVEFLTLSGEKGARLRATVTEFGPVLFSKIVGLNETQAGVVAVVFKYCDDHNLPLLDLKDLKKTLQYLTNEGKEAVEAEYGKISTTTVGAIMRKVVELEQQGADLFFGERSFDVNDLCRLDEEGRGFVSIVRLTDIQDRPKLFSTFMLQLLAEIYASFPEEGDLEKPKLVLFMDEAHLIFSEASSALLDQIASIVRLIRSKGVGIFFVSQNPADIPDVVLGQLGLKIQHSLRAFTAKDRKAIKTAAENYPETDFYEIDRLITELGIGEALVTALNEKGVPTPLAHTLLRAPASRMDILTSSEIDALVKASPIVRKYNEVIDSDSAHEILSRKIEKAKEDMLREQQAAEQAKATADTKPRSRTSAAEKSVLEQVLSSPVARQVGRTAANVLVRGLLGALGLSGRSRR